MKVDAAYLILATLISWFIGWYFAPIWTEYQWFMYYVALGIVVLDVGLLFAFMFYVKWQEKIEELLKE